MILYPKTKKTISLVFFFQRAKVLRIFFISFWGIFA